VLLYPPAALRPGLGSFPCSGEGSARLRAACVVRCRPTCQPRRRHEPAALYRLLLPANRLQLAEVTGRRRRDGRVRLGLDEILETLAANAGWRTLASGGDPVSTPCRQRGGPRDADLTHPQRLRVQGLSEASRALPRQRGQRAVAVWHRRAGKDLATLNRTAKAAHERKGLYCTSSDHDSSSQRRSGTVIHLRGPRLCIETVFPLAYGLEGQAVGLNSTEMSVDLRCGARIQLVGSDNLRPPGGQQPDSGSRSPSSP